MLINKKAVGGMKFLIGFLIVMASLFTIIYVWKVFFDAAEGATAEQLCRNFNAARTQGKVKLGEFTFFNLAPRTCKRLDENIPSGDYEKTVEGTMSEIGYLTARCWWQWLEGIEEDVFGTKGPFGKNKCFICYSFKIKKSINSFSGPFFKTFLDNTGYITKDSSDRCNVNGGGYCRAKEGKCLEGENKIVSSRCPQKEINGKKTDQICCNINIDCLNKGGTCSDTCAGDSKEYNLWSCRGSSQGEKCCIEEDNFLSYTGYVQRYMGEGTVIVAVDEFKPLEEIYAITFIGKTPAWGDLRKQVGEKYPFPEDAINSILISKLNSVSEICSIEED